MGLRSLERTFALLNPPFHEPKSPIIPPAHAIHWDSGNSQESPGERISRPAGQGGARSTVLMPIGRTNLWWSLLVHWVQLGLLAAAAVAEAAVVGAEAVAEAAAERAVAVVEAAVVAKQG